MTDITDNKILIPISSEDQKYVESVCTNDSYSFQTFFQHLLRLYKNSLNEPLTQPKNCDEDEKPRKKK